MAKKLTKVDINSTTIKDSSSGSDPKLLINWELDQKIERDVSEMILNCKRTVVDTISLKVGQTVEVWEGFSTSTDTKIFSGFISSFKLVAGTYEIVCKDKMYDLVRKTVSETYLSTGTEAGQVSAIAQDLIQTHGGLTASVVATGTATGQTIDIFPGNHSSIFERLQKLAKAVKYQIFYDAQNDTVHFEPRGYTDNGVLLTVGTEIVNVPDWEDDDSMLINDLRVDGAVQETQLIFPDDGTAGQIGTTANFETTGITLPHTPENVKLTIDASNPPTTVREGGGTDSSTTNFYYVDKENFQVKPATGTTFTSGHYAIAEYTWFSPHPIHMINQGSIDEYGTYKKQIKVDDIKSIADAEARTREILSRFSEPFKIGKIQVKDDNSATISIGDKVRVIDQVSSPTIDQKFVITRIMKRFPAPLQEVVVGDESVKLQDWQVNVEERLRRIEEQGLVNESLLAELRDFFFTISPVNRFVKVLSQTYNSGSGISMYGFGTSDGYHNWGSGKWGEHSNAFNAQTTHYVAQYLNKYTEKFLDTKFKNTSNTTATWSTGGSVTFTSGQIAESESVDYNNGTITQAKLTATETSGSFTYEVTADGTNWETVTSGTLHTFTNTGTDLRWRATENAASTGGISQVVLESYH